MKLSEWKLYSIYALGHILQGSPEADKKYLKILFKYLMGKECNFDNPQTYSEKLQWLKIYDRNPLYTQECVIIWATKRPERGHYESDSMAVKIDAGDDNPAADPCGVAGEVVCSISASLFCMVFLSAGQCAIGDGGAFVPPAAVAGNGSTSNADRWIYDFYDTTGGRRRGGTSGTGGSNASAGMVHIK